MIVVFLVLFVIVCNTAHKCVGQQTYQYDAKKITAFRFLMLTGGIVILRATVGDKPDSLNFVLDTGSGGISLDSVTVDFLGLDPVDSDRTIRGIAGIRKVKYVRNLDLHLPGIDVRFLDFHINDYDILTSVYGLKIDGIIGFSFLSRYIVKIDYNTDMLEVWEQGKINYPRRGYKMQTNISSIPVMGASIIDNTKVAGNFFFDTGAGLSVLMSEEFTHDKKIFKPGKKMTITQAEGLGGKKPMNITTVKRLRFGKYKFRKVPAHVFDDEYKVTSYPILGGLIGNDLLRRFNLIINYAQREIHLSPNSHFGEPFDYSYTGLGIYYINGQVVIEDVLPNSPAQKAGLEAGDIIMGVDKNFSNDIQAYKNILQNAGAKVKMIVYRNSKVVELTLKVKSIL